MEQSDHIAVIYFDGLTRDYTVDMEQADLDAEIEQSGAHFVKVKKTEEGILFDVPSKQFGPFEILYQKSFGAKYEFVSADAAVELPEEVRSLLPADEKTYAVGVTVNAIQPAKTTVTVKDGEWIFKGYDADSKKSEENLKFIGTWEFKAGTAVNPSVKSDQTDSQITDKAEDIDQIVKTGDESNIAWWGTVLTMSVLSMILIVFLKRRKHYNS